MLHNFGLGEGGVFPDSLMIDAAGSLYGTALEGGPYQKGAPDVTESDNDKGGTAFKLTPQGGDAWTETVLYSFGKGASGTQPVGGLVFDNSGNLYGAAESGGRRDCPNGCGTLFELSPKEDGGWAAETLHEFKTQATGGYSPSGNLIFDCSGKFLRYYFQRWCRWSGSCLNLRPQGMVAGSTRWCMTLAPPNPGVAKRGVAR